MPALSLDPASRLICDLLRLDERPPDDLPERLRQTGLSAFVRQANTYHLAGSVYRRLRVEAKRSLLPLELLEQLRLVYLAQAAESMRRSQRLGLILAKLNQVGVPAIVLKGAYLGELIYPDPAERPMEDIDLLVRHAHLGAAAQALEALGYHPQSEYWLDVIEQTNHHLPPYLKTGAEPVEVHWTIESHGLPFVIDTDGLLRRAQSCQIAGQPTWGCRRRTCCSISAFILSSTASTLGCARLTMWPWSALISRRDWTGKCCQGKPGDWSSDGAAARALYLMLWLASECFGAPIPIEALRALQPLDYPPEIGTQALQLVTPPSIETATFPTSVAELVQKPGLRARLDVIGRYFFLPREVLATCYPPVRPDSWQIYLYYPIRWKDLLVKRWRMVWKLARRDPHTLSAATAQSARNEQEDVLMEWVCGREVRR